jgi:HEAT repeat protein
MDGVSGGVKTVVDPEGLLRSALEKIVFFECRVSQLESELAASRDAAARARADAAKAERRALQLEQAIASEKGARADADRRADELHDRVRLLEAERERLLGGLVDRARLSGAGGSSGEPPPEEGGADLAGFIAELRAEIETLRAFRAEVEAAGFDPGASARTTDDTRVTEAALPARSAPPARELPGPARGEEEARSPEVREAPAPQRTAPRHAEHETLASLATRYELSGRVGLTSRDSDRMKDQLATRADRALYERSMDDLTSPDPGRRVRAVRALEVLGSRASAPIMAAALGREESAEVKIALLATLARFGEPFAADLAERELADPRPPVRVAALEALASVAAGAAEARLAAALSDESPLVRRRAALLLGLQPGARAEEALAIALADADRGVARAAAVALSGRPSARAQGTLARGLEHPDASVRRAAGLALSRISGEPVDADAPATARRAASRRIAERLAGMDGEELRAAVLRSADAPVVRDRAVSAAEPPRSTPPVHVEHPGALGVGSTAAASAAASKVAAPASAVALPRRARAKVVVEHAPPATAPDVGAAGRSISTGTRTAVAVLAAPAPELAPEPDSGARASEGGRGGEETGGSDDVASRIVGEIRAALRGCTAEALGSALGEPAARIGAALGALHRSGAVAQRGTRWFMS